MKTKHILIIDDEVEILKTIEFILQGAGYSFAKATDGRDALKKVLEAEAHCKPFDLIITDIRMPGLNGLLVINNVRLMNSKVPILAITGFGTSKLYEQLAAKGCYVCLDKPFSKEELIEKVNALIENSGRLSGQTV